MGVLDLAARFRHKREMRESKDEILVGEVVRAMARRGHVADRFAAEPDLQRVRFRMDDPVLGYVHVALDRKTGESRVGAAVVGSKATMTVAGEVRNLLSDPSDVLGMWRSDLRNAARLGLGGAVKVDHELNSVVGRTTDVVEIDRFVLNGEEGLQALIDHLENRIERVREALRPFKR